MYLLAKSITCPKEADNIVTSAKEKKLWIGMQDFQGFARMLRGSSGIKEFASGLKKPAGASSSCFVLADVLSHADTKLVRK